MTGDEHKLIVDANPPLDLSKERREFIYEEAAAKQREAFEINKRKHNLRAVVRKFKVGDSVLVTNRQQSSAADKFAQKLAPIKRRAIVTKVLGNDTYSLKDFQNKEIGTHHANDIIRQ